MELILASKSPRRKEILEKQGFTFTIIESNFNEVTTLKNPIEICKYFALSKAKEVYKRINNKNALVIGADTIVYLDDEVLGKPKNKKEATKMLKKLSNKTHYVYTGFAIVGKEITINDYDETMVTFNNLSPKLIKEYVETGSPLDKAGAYGIQDDYYLVKTIKGTLNNVIGLPVEKIKKYLYKIEKGL